jgi:hypothetical protein
MNVFEGSLITNLCILHFSYNDLAYLLFSDTLAKTDSLMDIDLSLCIREPNQPVRFGEEGTHCTPYHRESARFYLNCGF